MEETWMIPFLPCHFFACFSSRGKYVKIHVPVSGVTEFFTPVMPSCAEDQQVIPVHFIDMPVFYDLPFSIQHIEKIMFCKNTVRVDHTVYRCDIVALVIRRCAIFSKSSMGLPPFSMTFSILYMLCSSLAMDMGM